MKRRLVPCRVCDRHLRAGDAVCPFCRARIAVVAASAGALMLACKETPKAAPDPASSATTVAAAPSAASPSPSPLAVSDAASDDAGAITDAGGRDALADAAGNLLGDLGTLRVGDGGGLLNGINPREQAAVYGGPPQTLTQRTGNVTAGSTTASRPIPNADRVVAGLRGRFRACYNMGLRSDPTQAGKVTLVAKVAPSGEVTGASVASNSGLSAQVASCLARALQNAQFDAPGGDGVVSLTVPLVFVVAQ